MTISESLLSISTYPIASNIIENILDKRELNGLDDINPTVRNSSAYQLAEADVYLFLSSAPDITQGGITISLDNKEWWKYQAESLYASQGIYKTKYGYKGSRL